MFWKWLTAGCAVLLLFIGAALLDCTYSLPFLSFVDAFDVCVEADLALPGGSVAVGTVFVVVGLAMIGYAWVPYLSDMYRQREGLDETSEALVKNVHRLPEEASGPVERLLHDDSEEEEDEVDPEVEAPAVEEVSVDLRQDPAETDMATALITASGPEGVTVSLLRKVELMEMLLREEKVAPGPVAKHWIELLREANELHSQQSIDERTFREANSRLLALYVSPDDDPYTAKRKVGAELGS